MNIPAPELKAAIRRLGASKSDTLFLDTRKGLFISQDPELTIVVQCEKLQDELGGVFAVNARKFTTVVNRMSGTVELTPGKALTLKSAKAKVEIELMAGKAPVVGTPKNLISLPLTTIKSLLSYAAIAADTNKAAEYGGVVQLSSINGGGFKAAGTDNGRLAFSSAATDNYCKTPVTYIIPLPAVAALERLEGDEFQAAESDIHFYFADKTTSIFARKLAKPFPDYEAFLPKEFKFAATVDSAGLKEVLRTVEPMVPAEGAHAVTVHFLDGSLRVSANSGGTAEDETAYTQVKPDPIFDDNFEFKTRMNFKHLLEFVNAVSGEILFQGNSDDSPVVLESGGKKLMAAGMVKGA